MNQYAMLATVMVVACGTASAVGWVERSEPHQEVAWQTPAVADVKTQALAWLDRQRPDAATKAKAEALWTNLPDTDGLLDRLAATFALADEDARQLVDLCSAPRQASQPPEFAWLADPKTQPLVAQNLRLYYGRWLARESLFDEAAAQLADLKPADVVEPAALLFYRAVVYDRLLEQEAAVESIDALLGGESAVPRRYAAVARLMQAELKTLEPDSLDHIARRMEDVGRRLDLGRAGPKVRQIEDGVIESLDKLVKKLEEQQQQQSGMTADSLTPSNPADQSRIMDGKGPGEVTKRDVGSQSGWGNLPPKAREEAMQEISREFPPHYRDAVEQYFRRLAGQDSEEK